MSRYCLRYGFYFCLFAALSACATTNGDGHCEEAGSVSSACAPPNSVDDTAINLLYESRTWIPNDELEFDPVTVAIEAKIPSQYARTKFLGSGKGEAVNSLAAKIWMIENAQHTIDATYYIFKRDLVGEAMLGALCNAVHRGVDIRFMVDSVGSIDTSHAGLKALATCAEQAGFMRNANGEITNKRARVQVVIFNAISKVFVSVNRRSHDKLLIVDGSFPDLAKVMTGGRNISLSYYGINEDGTPSPDTYIDAEILLRPPVAHDEDEYPLGLVAERYYTILFLFGDNKNLEPSSTADAFGVYETDRLQAQESLAKIKALPVVRESLQGMPEYFELGWYDSEVLIAHELDNLTNENLFTDAHENMARNENSIHHLLQKVRGDEFKRRRIVSPYLFAAQYYDDDGNLVFDSASNVREWLDQHPQASLEIVTNSVLTSDNFPAQAIIDMNMAPRLLLPPEMRERWLEGYRESELNPSLVGTQEWRELINHPRLQIYETGRLDDRRLGGDVDYGKLHAKYIVMDSAGFVGTTNFDSRSRLINNEMGFFFRGDDMAEALHADFELLKSRSYLWGSPEWLEFRRQVFELGGMKGNTAKSQRAIYKSLRSIGLDNQI